MCDWSHKCTGPGAALLAGGGTLSCEAYYETLVLPRVLARAELAQQQGEARFDAAKAQQCLDGLAALGCGGEQVLPKACQEVLRGSRGEGEACDSSVQCAPGLYCALQQRMCPGTCQPYRAEGEACEAPDACAPGLRCSSGTCREAAPKAEGDPCEQSSECGSLMECREGRCQRVASRFQAAEGEACTLPFRQPEDRGCAEGLACAAQMPAGPGGLQGTCRRLAAEGEPCAVLSFPSSCRPGLYCDGEPGSLTGTCRPLPAEGERCRAMEPALPGPPAPRCAQGLVCESANDTCIAAFSKPDGASCGDDEECQSAHCQDGRCAPMELCGLSANLLRSD